MFACNILAVYNLLSLNWHVSVCLKIYTTVTTTMHRSNKHDEVSKSQEMSRVKAEFNHKSCADRYDFVGNTIHHRYLCTLF